MERGDSSRLLSLQEGEGIGWGHPSLKRRGVKQGLFISYYHFLRVEAVTFLRGLGGLGGLGV